MARVDQYQPVMEERATATQMGMGRDGLQWRAPTLTGDFVGFHVKPPWPKIAKCHGLYGRQERFDRCSPWLGDVIGSVTRERC